MVVCRVWGGGALEIKCLWGLGEHKKTTVAVATMSCPSHTPSHMRCHTHIRWQSMGGLPRGGHPRAACGLQPCTPPRYNTLRTQVVCAAAVADTAMETVTVDLGDRAYPIYIGAGLLGGDGLLARHIAGKQVLIVTNKTIAPIYLDAYVLFVWLFLGAMRSTTSHSTQVRRCHRAWQGDPHRGATRWRGPQIVRGMFVALFFWYPFPIFWSASTG